MYLHGGAYISPLLPPHWTIIHALLRRAPAVVTVPMYPLAPRHTVDDALAFLDALTEHLGQQERPGRLVYAGDSAGGGLALAYALRQHDLGISPGPSALVLISPWVDVTLANPDIQAVERRDTMLASAPLRTCGTWWAGRRVTTDPAVSPLYADLGHIPAVSIFQGDHDLFLPDVTLLDQRIRQAGGASTLTIAPGGFHVYVGAPWTPEARNALDLAGRAIRGDDRR
jgi:RND superfamily putative drug exporter